MTSLQLRAAGPDDAEKVALLHADSWRRHYRGAYADSFLNGDVVADRRSVWSSRLAAPANSMTVVAEDDVGLVGFVHVVFDDDDRWGSLIDNLHVTRDRQRAGIGTALMTCAIEAVVETATSKATYLWVLEQNTAAQRFYRAFGGTCVEKATVSPPGGVPLARFRDVAQGPCPRDVLGICSGENLGESCGELGRTGHVAHVASGKPLLSTLASMAATACGSSAPSRH